MARDCVAKTLEAFMGVQSHLLFSLGRHSKQGGDEGHLPSDISFVHPVPTGCATRYKQTSREEVFHVRGFLCFDAFGSVVAIVLNQDARLARSLAQFFRALLTPLHIVVRLDET